MHKHDWVLGNDGEPFAFCLVGGIGGCQEILDKEEVERRLNATECLSAEDAKHWARTIMAYYGAKQKLQAYARSLEEIDERT